MASWIATINCLDETNTPTTLYFSDDGYKSRDGLYYNNKLVQPAKIPIYGNDGGLLNVMQRSSIGEIELTNVDGSLDYLADYALDGRDCVIQYVDGDTFTTWIKGIITRINQRGNSIYLTLKTLTEALDAPVNLPRYAGSGGVEGLTTTIMGQIKPRVYGTVYNATPVLCDSFNYVYQVSDLDTTTILNVHGKGVQLADSGISVESISALQSSNPPAGTYAKYKGYFKIGNYNTQELTCDAQDTGTFNLGDVFETIVNSFTFTGGKRIIAEIPTETDEANHIYQASNSPDFVIDAVYNDGTLLKFEGERSTNDLATVSPPVGHYATYQGNFRINPPLQEFRDPVSNNFEPIILGVITYDATNNAITTSTSQTITVNPDSVTMMNTYGKVGLYVNSEITYRELLDRLVKSIGAYWWIGNYDPTKGYASNFVNVVEYTEPDTNNIDLTIENWQIISAERTSTGMGQNGIPFYAVKAEYAKIETIQKDTLGIVPTERRARLLKGVFVKEVTDTSVPDVKAIHPQSTRLSFESALRDTTQVTNVVNRLLLQFKSRCDIVTITAYYNKLPSLTLNSTVKVFYNRLGYKNGVCFRLIGCELDVKRKSVTMQLIGYKI